ncbi:MAG: BsuBI/PstI family type II restriction endonuclease [Solirubrobacteraceae bacterium]
MNLQQEIRVGEARVVLAQLGFPAAQTNERSALVLLCLLELQADQPWMSASGDTRWRTYELMQWLRDHYDKDYAANSRETIRSHTLHQFIAAGLIVFNPDDLRRPVNSSANCYQIAPDALQLLRAHDEQAFGARLRSYLAGNPGLIAKYAQARGMAQISATLADGSTVKLTAGGQNVLIAAMIEQFCPRWTPRGRILYIGDAGTSDPVFDEQGMAALGLSLDKHGKLPDLVVYLAERNWLILMEAASSHGPVDAKRHGELARLFADCTAGLVFVSCFSSRGEMRRYLADIAWETEVWCADHADHLIHFDGERFLGPYA